MLTVHVVSTVGWMGAIASFLALAVTGLTSHETRLVDSSYIAMKVIGWRVIVPLGLASLVTGLVQSLGTTWGLFRHYWVLLKFVLTVVATVLLLLHMTAANRLADSVSQTALFDSRLHGLRIQIMADAASSRMRRTSFMSFPFGSGRGQSSRFRPGTYGHSSFVPAGALQA
jgi:hypothetical protein